MAGGGGGAWKVAYADFVTAMMAFFLVMWLVGQSQKVKEAIAEGFNPPSPARKTNRQSNRQTKTAVINPTQEKKAVGVAEPPTPYRQRAASSRKFNPMQSATLVFFADNSAELDEESQERLKQLVPWIAGKAQKIEIRGHASRRPLPPDSQYHDLWELCYARCQATSKFLEQQGIAVQRMRLSQAGGYEPYSNRSEPEAQARNSRVEVALLNELVTDMELTEESPKEPDALE